MLSNWMLRLLRTLSSVPHGEYIKPKPLPLLSKAKVTNQAISAIYQCQLTSKVADVSVVSLK
jgi:hypothetical protein